MSGDGENGDLGDGGGIHGLEAGKKYLLLSGALKSSAMLMRWKMEVVAEISSSADVENKFGKAG